MHVAVLLQHYHTPDCATAARPWALVQALVRHHEVTVVTTDSGRARRLRHDFEWVPPGVRLVELRVPYANAMTTAQRLHSYLGYAVRAVRAGLSLARLDLVYASSTPLTVGAAGAAVATYHGCPWVFEVRDLWPDFPVQMGALQNPLLRRAAYALEHMLYRRAAHVVAASPDMSTHVRRFVPRSNVSTVAYGTDLGILSHAQKEEGGALRHRMEQDGRPVVLYAGSFGRANDLPTLVAAARRLSEEARFVFAGRGYHRPLLEQAARRLPNVSLLDPLPYPTSLALFAGADLSVVSFLDRPVLRTNAPSKFFDSLAAGTPVIVTNPGWTKRFVEEHRCGWYAPPEQPAALARCIADVLHSKNVLRTASRKAGKAAHAHFDRAVHMKEILSIIEKVRRRQ